MKKLPLVLFPTLFLLPLAIQAEMYKWVDENGKIHFSNTLPPSNANQVQSSSEKKVDPETRALQIQQEQYEIERTAAEVKQPVDCAEDFNCFYNAAKTCSPATWIVPHFGNSFELRGVVNDKCVIYNDFLQTECRKSIESTTAMFERWKAGKMSTEDWDDCE